MVTAALVAGVGVAGVSAATAGAAPSHPDAPSLKSLARAGGQATAQQAGQLGAGPMSPAEQAVREHTAVQEGATELQATELQAAELHAAELWAAEQRTGREQTAREGAGISQEHGVPAPGRTAASPIADAAVAVRHKPRPKPVITTVPTVRWVNPLPEARVTSCYGQRWGRLHAGVDLAAANGTRIRAAGAGTVVQAGAQAGYGNAVLIDHGNGFLTHYGHMSTITVQAGQHVKVGEEIGHEGSTGHSTGPHLHFEVHQGTYKNPIEPTAWMHEHGVDIPGCADLTEK
ncbi:MAG TPA: peptidoglycan DD-metalloendopeptidase family protein [Actinoplanes sp.]|jgi:murein DD-endopeptidase MepM/ murein hydrolase activator NlpD